MSINFEGNIESFGFGVTSRFEGLYREFWIWQICVKISEKSDTVTVVGESGYKWYG